MTGILGLSSHGIYEVLRLFLPALSENSYWGVLSLAIILIIIMYGLLLVGKYSFFEKVLVVFVTIMGLSFIVSMFMVLPEPGSIARGLIPTIPKVPGGKLMVAAFVGTTMAAPTFVVRPLLLKGKGWNAENVKISPVTHSSGPAHAGNQFVHHGGGHGSTFLSGENS